MDPHTPSFSGWRLYPVVMETAKMQRSYGLQECVKIELSSEQSRGESADQLRVINLSCLALKALKVYLKAFQPESSYFLPPPRGDEAG